MDFHRRAPGRVVDSLYGVPDRETRELQTFYAGLRQRRGKLESLNAARLTLIERLRAERGAAHPFCSASFVLVGQPRGRLPERLV